MKGIVFGAGFLGNKISQEFNYKLISRKECDVANQKEVRNILEQEKPDVVINAVGKTSGPGAIGIDWCELHKEESIQSSIVAAINLCTECSLKKIYFVHLGSGCIYAGDNQGKGYSEEDEPNFYGPQFYAKTKIDSERILKNFPCLILRIRMPIDDYPNPRNLIDKIKVYKKLIDKENSMTTIPHFIKALKVLIDKRTIGVFNFTNPGKISPADIMFLYKKIVNPNHEFEVFSTDELDKITISKRSNCYLNTDKLQKELKFSGAELPEIHQAVRECLENYKKHAIK